MCPGKGLRRSNPQPPSLSNDPWLTTGLALAIAAITSRWRSSLMFRYHKHRNECVARMKDSLTALMMLTAMLSAQTAPTSFQSLSRQAEAARDAKQLEKA